MFQRTWFARAILNMAYVGSVIVATVAAAGAHAESRVYFIEPADGATVTSPVHVKFGVEGMTVEPAGKITPNTGHHHVLIDSGPLPQGQFIPENDHSLHYGKGQTEADIKLSPGDHKLTMQFGNGAHLSYGPAMSQTITVHVK